MLMNENLCGVEIAVEICLRQDVERALENAKRKTPGRLAEPALERVMRLFCGIA